MALLGIQQLNELDVLIKNTEFETLQQTKAITEEKQKIEALHVQLQEYQNKLKSLKEAATTSEENERKLSVQLIQQKENYESLKKTSAVLDDHLEALQRKLHLLTNHSKDQRNTQLNAVDKYQSKWQEYEQKYQSSDIAQEFLTLREEFETLASRKLLIEDEISSLQSKLSVPDHFEKAQKGWIHWIVRIATLRVETEGNACRILELNRKYGAKLTYLEIKMQEVSFFEQEIQQIKIKQKEKAQASLQLTQMAKPHEEQHQEPQHITPSSEKLSLRLELPKPSKTQLSKKQLPAKRNIFTLNLPSQPTKSVREVPTTTTVIQSAVETPPPLPKPLSTSKEPARPAASEDDGGTTHQPGNSESPTNADQSLPSSKVATVTDSTGTVGSPTQQLNEDSLSKQSESCPSQYGTSGTFVKEGNSSLFSESDSTHMNEPGTPKMCVSTIGNVVNGSVQQENQDVSTTQTAHASLQPDPNDTHLQENISSFFSESAVIPSFEFGFQDSCVKEMDNAGASEANSSSLFDFSTAGQIEQQTNNQPLNQENVTNGGSLFTEEHCSTSSNWFEKGDSSNFDMFSSFCNGNGSAPVGGFFGETSDVSKDGGVVSLFGSPKTNSEEASGFQMMDFDEPSTSSLFSLFR